MNPPWAIGGLTETISKIRSQGENHVQEFKENFPGQGHELAREVAAFATSGGGIILIGVDDDGNVVGLNEADRDGLYHRAQGIVRQVRPAVKHDISFAYDGGFILTVYVRDDQTEPVFYYEHRPYIRDGRTSRPATPEEVKERVWAHGSSEHKRRMEDLKYKMVKSAADQSDRRTDAWDKLSLESAAMFSDLVNGKR